MEEPKQEPEPPTARPGTLPKGSLDRRLLFIVTGLMTALGMILIGHLGFQLWTYSKGIDASLKLGGTFGHATFITYTRAIDFSVVKAMSVFMGFMLVFVGALYLLRVAEAAYSVALQSGEFKASFQTASPGLVLATLGVVCVLFALYEKSSITLEAPWMQAADLNVSVNNQPGAVQNNSADSAKGEVVKNISLPNFSFAKGAITLSESEIEKVGTVCRDLGTNGIRSIAVEAHGDRGESAEMNLALSERRANYLRQLLKDRCSPGLKVTATSYGKERPEGGEHGQATIQPNR